MNARPVHRGMRGFTLIEVMVALLILAVMAGMAWKGADGIVKAREIADGNVRRTLRLQSVMTQWQADLSAVLDTKVVDALKFDGAALRLTRQTPGGMQVVVWALRSGRWVRWAGPAVTTVGQLQEQWTRSFQYQGREPGSTAALKGVEQWQLYFFRGGAWTNAQSSAGTAQAAAPGSAPSTGLGLALASQAVVDPLPMGVRSVLTLGEGSGYQGRITRDVLMSGQD
ncbi:MAG: prepilin-type N-terminal cleavage/methylation domain-containing protein [Rubrivivax sp.]|nr:MAG: prepilin-type N-terminal cleavage/methylation domain-containing protein [Rubrivivax sp.]